MTDVAVPTTPAPDDDDQPAPRLYGTSSPGTFDGVEFGVRWDNGDLAWFFTRKRAEEARTGPYRLMEGTLIQRRLVVGPVTDVPVTD